MNNPSPDALATLDSGRNELPLTQISRILSKHKWLILACIAVIPTAVGIYVSKQPKVYEAATTVIIDATVPQYLGPGFRDAVEIEANWWSAQEALQTEFRVLGSHSQALAVARALCVTKVDPKDEQFMLVRLMPSVKCDDEKQLSEIAAPVLQSLLKLEWIKDSRVVTLAVRYSDPVLAAALVNNYAQVYVRRNLERRTNASEGANAWLSDEYTDLQTQLNDAERALIDFKRKNNILAVGLEDQQNELSQRRKKLSDELSSTQVKLLMTRASREQYRQLMTDDPLTSVAPGVTDSGVVLKLKELYLDQYNKLVEMRGKYLEKHPLLIAQETRLQQIRTDLKHEATMAISGIEASYAALLKQEKDLKVALDSATHDALALEQKAIEFNRLKRNFDRLSKLSDQVGGRERETALAGHLKMNNVRVLDAALVPAAPISPNVPRSVGIALAVSVLLGFGLAFLLEMADSTVRSQDDMERLLGAPFLGLIPKITGEAKSSEVAPPPALSAVFKTDSGRRDLYALVYPKSAVAECARAIRTNLLFAKPDDPPRTLLITSAGPQDGKTTTSVNLAISLAQSGQRVLLVDTDMRKPRLHKVFGIPASLDGISKAIVGEIDALKAVRETGIPNLSLLPCGAIPPNPAELLHSERFKQVLEQLVKNFDRVLLDSPPVEAVTDAAILSQLTSGTIFVAKVSKTNKHALARARRVLTNNGKTPLLGCVLNDLDVSRQSGYEYYYYSRYGSYYGKSDEEIAKESS